MRKKLNLLRLFAFSILFLVSIATVCHSAEKVVRTIEIQYPSKKIKDSVEVAGVPGCKYTFKVVGNLPEGTHIEWSEQSTTKGSWNNNVLYPYQTGGGSGTYHIKAVLVGGGGGEGAGWEVDVNGTITDPVLTYSEPGEDVYFCVGQTDPAPHVDLKVTVTKPGGTKLEGVSVLFIAKKSDGSIVNIGSSSSNKSGEATKVWNVPVSAVEVYTLKAGTGSNPESLENETTGKKVSIVKVEVLNVDASSPSATKVNYKVTGGQLPSVTFTAPKKRETRTNISEGDFYFTFDQNNLSWHHTNTISLDTDSCGKLDVTATRTDKRTPDAQELLIAYFLIPGVGYRQYNHWLAEEYHSVSYSVPFSGKTIWLGKSFSKLNIHMDWQHISNWIEKHKYTYASGSTTEKSMVRYGGWGVARHLYRRTRKPEDIWPVMDQLNGIARTASLCYDGIPGSLANKFIDRSIP